MRGVKEAKLAKEKRDAHYPTPEEPQRCIVCRDMTATISCMECPNKACQACIRHECLDKGEPFLYFHHRHCLRLAHRTCAQFTLVVVVFIVVVAVVLMAAREVVELWLLY